MFLFLVFNVGLYVVWLDVFIRKGFFDDKDVEIFFFDCDDLFFCNILILEVYLFLVFIGEIILKSFFYYVV